MKKQLLSVLFVAGFATSALAQTFTVSGPRTIYRLPANKTGKGRAVYTFFNLTTGKEVAQADSNTTNWDIAFSGMNIKLNGGTSGISTVTGQVLTATSFNSQLEAPVDNYTSDATANAILGNGGVWSYDGAGAKGTHSVTPIPTKLAAIKLADGRYVKLEVLNYYRNLPANIPVDINNTSPANYFEPKENGVSTSKFVSFRYQIAPTGTTDWSQLVTKVSNLKAGVANADVTDNFQLFDIASADTLGIITNTAAENRAWLFGFGSTRIITNGGVSGPGKDSAQVVIGAFNSLTTAIVSDYKVDQSSGLAIMPGAGNGWYNYDQEGSHGITTIQNRSIVFHDSLGRYGKIVIENYYKGAPSLACGDSKYYTFSYYYNPYGGTETSLAGRNGKSLDATTNLAFPGLANLTLSPSDAINAVAAGVASDSITVTTNTDWVAEGSEGWITLGVKNNKFVVDVAANTGTARTGKITVTACNIAREIEVKQAAATTTAFEDATLASALVLYPNPSAGTVKVASAEAVQVTVTDLQGQVVFAGTVEAGQELNTGLNAGVYVAKLVSTTQQTTQKLIIQ